MGRRRPVDFVNWRMYRRAWLVPAAALVLVLVTSFHADQPTQGALPPTAGQDEARSVAEQARHIHTLFPDRRTGQPGGVDSAQWMRDEFRDAGLSARTITTTTQDPATGRSIGVVNVEALLPGRTRELVVITAHRDTEDTHGRGGDAVGQAALLSLARDLKSTLDRRRSYLFVSTDAATLNGAGARRLSARLTRRGGVIAVINLDRIAGSRALQVDASPSGLHAPPLGLAQAADGAVRAEGGAGRTSGAWSQLLQLTMPLTLREHGQLIMRDIPAVTLTAADDQLRDGTDSVRDTARIAASLRAVQRLLGTIDQLDQLQSAGRTWVATAGGRVYRGWALKLLIAALLVPVWVSVVDMLVRHRRGWNLAQSIGTIARVMLAGVSGVAMLWLLSGIGLFPGSLDRPPNPARLDDVHVFALLVWLLVSSAAWLIARGPDWRRRRSRLRAGSVQSPDTADVVLTQVTLVVLAVVTLAISPYAVLLAVPALHAWLWVASWRVAFDPRRALAAWCMGLTSVLAIVWLVAARADTGAGTLWYVVQLVQSRTIPPVLSMLAASGGAVAALLLIASRGHVADPALPQLRARWRAVHDGEQQLITVTRARTLWKAAAAKLRVPTAARLPRRAAPVAAAPKTARERARERAHAREAAARTARGTSSRTRVR